MPVVDFGAPRRGCRTTTRSSWSCWVSSRLSVKSSSATYGERTSRYSQDINPLRHLHSAELGATEQRWVAELVAYNFSVKYRPAKEHKNADALSRHPIRMPDPEDPETQWADVTCVQPTTKVPRLSVTASATITNQQILPD